MPLIKKLLLWVACNVALVAPVASQEQTMIVLDASGSMWGQIEGDAKIAIAQRAVREILSSPVESRRFGLIAYGHRRRGDCADIELLVPTAAGNTARIADVVDRLQPRGKTPMTDSVIAAAGAMRHTEEAATVILVSDGVETCAPDPCLAARTLEETGVSFTAHVIGFDVTDPAAVAQLSCIAAETGGLFLQASNAGSLSDALKQIVEAAPSADIFAPERAAIADFVEVTWSDYAAADTPHVMGIRAIGSDTLINASNIREEGRVLLEMPVRPGQYEIFLARTGSPVAIGARVIDVFDVPVTLDAPAEVVSGTAFDVRWTGPGYDTDFIGLGPVGAELVNRYAVSSRLDAQTSQVTLTAPGAPGEYVLQYFLQQDQTSLFSMPVTVVLPPVELLAPDVANAGSTISIDWSGPGNPNDRIYWAPAGGTGSGNNYVRTAKGNPAQLTLPGAPGAYELQYWVDGTILGSRPISVVVPATGLAAVDTTVVGSLIEIEWQGPGNANDRIYWAPEGGEGSGNNYARTTSGNPVTLRMPGAPGTYELQYWVGNEMLASRPIEVTAAVITLDGPASAPAGETVEITWTGPNNRNDAIVVTSVGSTGRVNWRNSVDTSDGNPARVTVPSTPGSYEIQYRLGVGTFGTIAGTRLIEVTE